MASFARARVCRDCVCNALMRHILLFRWFRWNFLHASRACCGRTVQGGMWVRGVGEFALWCGTSFRINFGLHVSFFAVSQGGGANDQNTPSQWMKRANARASSVEKGRNRKSWLWLSSKLFQTPEHQRNTTPHCAEKEIEGAAHRHLPGWGRTAGVCLRAGL